MQFPPRKNARTTQAIRAEIVASKEITASVDYRYGVTEKTVYKWKKYDRFPSQPDCLQRSLPSAQETMIYLCQFLLLSLDCWLSRAHFICQKASFSRLERCLRSHAAGHYAWV